MTLEIAIQTALMNARLAAALAETLALPNFKPVREQADALIELSGRLSCAAREMQARIMGLPEAHRGD